MSRALMLLPVTVVWAACAAGTAERPAESTTAGGATSATTHAEHRPSPPADTDAWKRRPADDACRAALGSLAAGELDRFGGLGACGRVDAEAALGSSGEAPSRFEQFGEYRVYPHAGGDVLVWFLGGEIRVMQLLYPKLSRPLQTVFGAPEAKTKSELSPEWDQWIYASRGLTAHVKRGAGDVVTLFVYRPTTVEKFLETDIAKVSKSEAPLEELK
jgi:hypothetical protein